MMSQMEFNTAMNDMSIEEIDKNSADFVTQRQQKQERQSDSITVSDFNSFKEEMRQLIMYYTNCQQKDVTDLKDTVKEIKQSTINIEASLEDLHVENRELRKHIGELESHISENREHILYLEEKLDEMQCASRKSNFEIKNVPRRENESKQDLVEMVTTLAETVDCKIDKRDINDIYRIRYKKSAQKNAPIVVETNSTLLKNDLLKMAKSYNIRNKTKLCAKHLGLTTQGDTPVFLSENLTSKAARLHFLARDLSRSKSYKYCWTSYGKVYVRKSDQSPIILIKNEEQVHNLIQGD
jgi:chromosome segregation ATPase